MRVNPSSWLQFLYHRSWSRKAENVQRKALQLSFFSLFLLRSLGAFFLFSTFFGEDQDLGGLRSISGLDSSLAAFALVVYSVCCPSPLSVPAVWVLVFISPSVVSSCPLSPSSYLQSFCLWKRLKCLKWHPSKEKSKN